MINNYVEGYNYFNNFFAGCFGLHDAAKMSIVNYVIIATTQKVGK